VTAHEEWARQVAAHLCEVWGWQPDEPEAQRLGQNLAHLLPQAVAGTRTSPESLLATLLHEVPAADGYKRALRDVRNEILNVTSFIDGHEVVFADDIRHDLGALSLHNPFTGPPTIVITESES